MEVEEEEEEKRAALRILHLGGLWGMAAAVVRRKVLQTIMARLEAAAMVMAAVAVGR